MSRAYKKYSTSDNLPIQVESAIRDGSGKNIENNYAKQDGYYSSLTSGLANNLNSDMVLIDTDPYLFRTAGGSLEISDTKKVEQVRGNAYAPTPQWDSTTKMVKTAPNKDYTIDVSKVEGVGYKVNQLVANGNFDGTSGWVSGSQVESSIASNNVLTITTYASTDSTYVGQNKNFINGHKYLVLFDVKNNDSNTSPYGFFRVGTFGSTYYANYDIGTTFTKCYKLFEFVETSGNYAFYAGARTSTAVALNYSMKNVMCFDLTADFGSGNEPSTVSDCASAYLQRGINIYEYTPQQSSIKNNAFTGATIEGSNLWWYSGYVGKTTEATYQSIDLSSNPIKAGTYTMSAIVSTTDTNTVGVRVAFRNSSQSAITAIDDLPKGTERTPKTFTLTEDCYYVFVYANVNTSANNYTSHLTDIMLNRGNSALSYQPYVAPTTISVDLTTIKDSNNVSLFPSGKLMGNSSVADFITPYNQESRYFEKTLNGTEEWRLNGNWGGVNAYETTISDIVGVENSDTTIRLVSNSNTLQETTAYTIINTSIKFAIAVFSNHRLAIKLNTSSSSSDINTFLRNNPITIQVERATYLTSNTDLTSLTRINAQSNGTITLNNTDNVDMPNLISYYKQPVFALPTEMKNVGFNAYNNETGTAELIGGNQYQLTGTYTSFTYTGGTITLDASGKFTPTQDGTLTIVGGNATTTCVHLVWDGERDGEFEEYKEYSYPISISSIKDANDNIMFPEGLRKAGTVFDEVQPLKAIKRIGRVDLGTLDYNYTNNDGQYCFEVQINELKNLGFYTPVDEINLMVSYYNVETWQHNRTQAGYDMTVSQGGKVVSFRNSNYTDPQVFKTAMSGVYLYYELAEQEEVALPSPLYTEVQVVSNWGTEKFIDTREVKVEVGTETEYLPDLKAKLESAPESPEDDGLYVMERELGLNSYKELDEALGEKGYSKTEDLNLSQYAKSQDVTNEFNELKEDLDDGNLVVKQAEKSVSAESLDTTIGVDDQTPFNYQTAGGDSDITTGIQNLKKLVGASVVFNQLINYPAVNSTNTKNGITETYLGNGRFKYSGRATGGSVFGFGVPILNNVMFINVNYISNNTGRYVKQDGVGNITQPKIYKHTNANALYAYYVSFDTTLDFDIDMEFTIAIHTLTQAFGSQVADYINAKEQANAGDGVAIFKSMFPNDYYPYNTGTFIHSQSAKLKMVDYNQWDEQWELGTIESNGQTGISTTKFRSKNFNECKPDTTYYFYVANPQEPYVFWYDNNYNFIKFEYIPNRTKTSPNNAHYFKIRENGTTYNNSICISLYWDGSRIGYEPYQEHIYELPNDELKGILKVVDNKIVADGDEEYPDGTKKTKIIELTINAENIVDYGQAGVSNYYSALTNIIPPKKPYGVFTTANIGKSSNYLRVDNNNLNYLADKTIALYTTTLAIRIRDDSITTLEGFKALCPIKLIYRVADDEVTESTSTAFAENIYVDDFGTMEFLDENNARIAGIQGNEIFYKANISGFAESLYVKTDGDVDELVTQKDIEDTALATRGYIKLTSITGYDATKTQVLKNIEGVFTWVDEA